MGIKKNLFIISSLLILTFLLMFLYKSGLYNSEEIKILNNGSVYGQSDQNAGGKTTFSLDFKNESVILDCDIKNDYRWPYCEVKINLVNTTQDSFNFHKGKDFSSYEEIFIKIKDHSSEKRRVRLYIRNYNEAYTDLISDENSLKVNEIEFRPASYEDGITIKLSDFNVASWWTREKQIDPEFQGLEMTSVPLIEIASGGGMSQGDFKIEIEKIEFRKELISQEDMLFGIILIWWGTGFGYFIMLSNMYRKQLFNSKKKEKKMKEIYEILKIEKEQIVNLAKRDELTGLKNRRGLTDDISILEKNFRTKAETFSVIFMDIDFFKKVNDTYGHDIGDEILKEYSRVINQNIRISDYFARWGGEEFVLLCSDTSIYQATKMAEKLCRTIESHKFINDLRITSSFGISEYVKNDSISNVFKRADTALYEAKESGRNKVRVKEKRFEK